MKDNVYNYQSKLLTQINKTDPAFNNELSKFKKIYEKNKATYEKISKKTGVPPELIAVIHYRESGCDFNTYLHNGDPLGKPTVNVPVGKNFNNFFDAAVDALKDKKNIRDLYKLSSESNDMAALLAFAERFNGLGYYNKGIASPYTYSGTNVYKGGKYTSDGHFDPKAKDKQPGTYILLMSIKN